MSAATEIKQLQAAGFSTEEIGAWSAKQRADLTAAGFAEAEIDTYFGQPPFDPKPVQALVQRNVQAAQATPTEADQKPTTFSTFTEALEAGWQMSVTGLLTRGKKPEKVLLPEAGMGERLAASVGSLAGDLPAMLGGAGLGVEAGPIGMTAGAFALPAGMRSVLMDKYEKGEVTTFAEFWERAAGATLDTLKGYVTGAATAVAGLGAGKVLEPLVSPTVKAAGMLASEVATMVTVGKALEGEVPNQQDFLDAAVVLFGVKGAVKGAEKLRKIYAETGVKPAEVLQDAQKDAGIAQEVASSNVEIPKAYGGSRPPPEEPPTPTVAATPPEPPTPGTLAADQKAILDRIVQEDPEAKGLSFERLYTALVDNLNPILVAEKAAGGRKVTSESPYGLERLTRGVMGKGMEFLKHGAFDFETYKTVTQGYEQILEPVKKDLDGFRAYMASKRAIELAGRDIQSGMPLEEAKRVVAAGRGKYELVFQARLHYRDAMVDYLHKSGILSADAVDAMKEANKDYVPFYRLFEEDEQGRPTTAKKVGQPIKRIKGSERKILDPIVSDIKDTFLFVALAEKNSARQAFVSLGPNFAEKVKVTVKPIFVSEHEIERMFDAFMTMSKKVSTFTKTESSTTTGGTAGEDLGKTYKLMEARVKEALLARGFHEGEATQMMARLANPNATASTTTTIRKEIERSAFFPVLDIRLPHEAATIFRPGTYREGKNDIVVFNDGKREVYTVDPEVAEAFNATDQISGGFLANMLRMPASLLRAGVTVSPDFFPRNIIRDAVSAFIYAGSNPIKTLKGAKSLLSEDTAFHNWMKAGGANATIVAMDRDYIGKELFSLNAKTGLMERALNVVKTPVEVLRVISELTENATRLGSVRDPMGQAQTKAQMQALALISKEATVDFSRHGGDPFFREWTRTTAFMNPGIQGLDRMIRAFHDNPKGTIAKSLAAITLPSLLLWWANHDDPRWDEIPRWQKDLFWIVMTDDHIYRLPKPFEVGIMFGTLPERMLEQFVADNPSALKDLDATLGRAFGINILPTAAIPVLEQFANRSTFTGTPLIPDALEKLMPEYQYTDYTLETTKALGHLMGSFPGLERAALGEPGSLLAGTSRALTSPILVEHYVRAWSGGMGMYALKLADKALREAKVVPDPVQPLATLADLPVIKAFVVRYPSASAQSIQDFYDAYTEKKKVFDTFMAKAKEGDETAMRRAMAFDQSAMVQLDDLKAALTEHGRLVRLIAKNPDIPADEQRQLIDATYGRMIELARYGNQALREVERAVRDQPTPAPKTFTVPPSPGQQPALHIGP